MNRYDYDESCYEYDEYNEYDELDDEDDENDDLYRPKKSNSRKALLPLFVYSILKSDENHHFSQKEILTKLEEYPFEITIERKALSRTLHSLEDEGLGVCSSKNCGVWYDSKREWASDAA